jgi:glycosyltransferase involved in cell wall biosynthesis
MNKTKVCYIVSNIHKSLAFEWIASGLDKRFQLEFILLNPSSSPLEEFLKNLGVPIKRITYRGKKDFISACFKTVSYLSSSRPKIVHAHLLDAQLVGLGAARLVGIRSRIYTRHTSNFHHVYHPKGVLLDRLSNRLATQIISISQATDITLFQLEQVPKSKVKKIPHGFDLKVFSDVPFERINLLKKKWNIGEGRPVVGVIARQIEWKGVQFIIPAFAKLMNEYPNAQLVLANATGPYHQNILELLKYIPRDRVVLIPFEEDIAALYPTFDLYVHVPTDPLSEAFGQTYVESLAAGVPSVFTLSGVAAEFIEADKNAVVVNYKNEDSIYHALTRLLNDDNLRKNIVVNGRRDVFSRFQMKDMIYALEKLYDEQPIV